VSHVRHAFRSDFAGNSGTDDGVALATPLLMQMGLPANELDEGSDDAVEQVVQGWVLLNVTADDGDFQTRERFAGRAERAVVAHRAIVSAAVHAFRAGVKRAAFARAERGGRIAWRVCEIGEAERRSRLSRHSRRAYPARRGGEQETTPGCQSRQARKARQERRLMESSAEGRASARNGTCRRSRHRARAPGGTRAPPAQPVSAARPRSRNYRLSLQKLLQAGRISAANRVETNRQGEAGRWVREGLRRRGTASRIYWAPRRFVACVDTQGAYRFGAIQRRFESRFAPTDLPAFPPCC
jgi:hypothetical protein